MTKTWDVPIPLRVERDGRGDAAGSSGVPLPGGVWLGLSPGFSPGEGTAGEWHGAGDKEDPAGMAALTG